MFYPQLFDAISAPVKDLIKRLLKVNPEERISAAEVLAHPWLQDPFMIKKAEALMATQIRTRKRLLEVEMGAAIQGDKRLRQEEYDQVERSIRQLDLSFNGGHFQVDSGVSVSVFKTPVGGGAPSHGCRV